MRCDNPSTFGSTVVKFTKFIVLGGGLLGLLSFFMPLIAVKAGPFTGTVSPLQMVTGIDSLEEVVENAPMADSPEGKRAVEDFNREMGEVKGVVLACYAPALLLTLFGVLGVVRKKFGRGLGAGTLIFGLISLAIWAIINSAANEVKVDQGQSVKGIGMHLLMVASLAGSLGGLLALIKPDRGEG